jgi:HK97 family phage prohead protease
MKKQKRISFKCIEIRSSEHDGKRQVEGIIPYNSESVPIWGVIEVIDKDAFKKTLEEKNNVRALFNHNDSKVLGSTKSGTLTLEDSSAGLVCRCELPNTTYANDLFEVISRGDVKTMSFGFYPIRWVDDGTKRVLKEVELDEVSFGVAYPAYPETNSEVSLRSYLNKRNMDMDKIQAILVKIDAGETLTDEEKNILREFIKPINEILQDKTEETQDPPPEQTASTTDEGEGSSDAEDAEAIALVETAIELEILDLEELEAEVQEELEKEGA